MAVLEIVKHPNEVLETPCERVMNFDKKLVKLLKDMHETMLIADGVGLAAPQVGVSLQVAVVDIGDDTGKIELINPSILEKRGEQVGPEGCLSFRDFMVKWNVRIILKYVRKIAEVKYFY